MIRVLVWWSFFVVSCLLPSICFGQVNGPFGWVLSLDNSGPTPHFRITSPTAVSGVELLINCEWSVLRGANSAGLEPSAVERLAWTANSSIALGVDAQQHLSYSHQLVGSLLNANLVQVASQLDTTIPYVFQDGDVITCHVYTYKKVRAGQAFTVTEYDEDLTHTWDSPNEAPQVTQPADQSNEVGDSVSLQIVATDPDDGPDPLSYFLNSPLPPGLTLNESTGLITGTCSETFDADVTLGVEDGDTSDTVTFHWTVTPDSGGGGGGGGYDPPGESCEELPLVALHEESHSGRITAVLGPSEIVLGEEQVFTFSWDLTGTNGRVIIASGLTSGRWRDLPVEMTVTVISGSGTVGSYPVEGWQQITYCSPTGTVEVRATWTDEIFEGSGGQLDDFDLVGHGGITVVGAFEYIEPGNGGDDRYEQFAGWYYESNCEGCGCCEQILERLDRVISGIDGLQSVLEEIGDDVAAIRESVVVDRYSDRDGDGKPDINDFEDGTNDYELRAIEEAGNPIKPSDWSWLEVEDLPTQHLGLSYWSGFAGTDLVGTVTFSTNPNDHAWLGPAITGMDVIRLILRNFLWMAYGVWWFFWVARRCFA